METLGRTSESYDDYWADDPQPRIYRLTDVTDPDNPRPAYHGMAPCGHRFYFNERHVVVEEPDGTFTVSPQPTPPSGQNSILCRACGWHGYIDHNVWRTV